MNLDTLAKVAAVIAVGAVAYHRLGAVETALASSAAEAKAHEGADAELHLKQASDQSRVATQGEAVLRTLERIERRMDGWERENRTIRAGGR